MPTLTLDERRSLMYQHRYAAGQHVSYAEPDPAGPGREGTRSSPSSPMELMSLNIGSAMRTSLTTASSGNMSSPKTWAREKEGNKSKPAAERSAMAFRSNGAG